MISSADIPEPFESYSGEGPYVFVSYAHADKIPVYQSMREFRDAGVNMWYDEGIQPAGEWVEEIAHAIKSRQYLLSLYLLDRLIPALLKVRWDMP